MDSSSFEARLVLIPRKLQYTSTDSNLWKMIFPPQMIKTLRLVHDSTYLVSSEYGSVCIRVHNSVEYGMEYSFLKAPKVLVTEELIKSLNVSMNEVITLKFGELPDIGLASSLELAYLEFLDKDGIWKRCVSKDGGKDEVLLRALNWCNHTEELYPSPSWWNSLLKGDYNFLIKSSLLGAVLFKNNIILLNLKSVVARFKVLDVKGKLNEPYRITDDCKINVKLEHKFKKVTSDVPSVPKLGGMKESLDIIKWHVIYPLVYKEKYSKLQIQPPKGVLLYGPPGTGKTLLARCIKDDYKNLFSIEDQISFKMVQSTDLISSHVGKTEENLTNLFRECALTPGNCICFIDEIDVLCQSRDKDDFNRRTVTTFLNNLDGLNTSSFHNFVIFGMTNDLDSLDIALRRPGRFELELEIGVPTSKDRLDILKTLLSSINHNLTEENILYINDFCQAFVGADVRLLISNASISHLNRFKESDFEDSCITLEDFKEALKLTRPSALKELYIQVPDVKWDDIGGYEDVKLSLKECVEYPRIYGDAYEKLQIQPPKGVLLYGPPGCSKTLMAKAIATESHMNFISVKGPELFSKWVGESERAIRQIFKKARVNSPCVIFFDEIDSIALDRDESDSTGVGNRVLSQLLNEMDGISVLKQVVVIGATNRPDMLDPALLRPGRLDRLIYIPLPDLEARSTIFKIYLKRLYTSLDVDQVSSELANDTDGYSGAEIAMVCKESALCALREYINQRKYSLEDQFKTLNISNEYKDIIPISYKHLQAALSRIKPRISKDLIEFYEKYHETHPL